MTFFPKEISGIICGYMVNDDFNNFNIFCNTSFNYNVDEFCCSIEFDGSQQIEKYVNLRYLRIKKADLLTRIPNDIRESILSLDLTFSSFGNDDVKLLDLFPNLINLNLERNYIFGSLTINNDKLETLSVSYNDIHTCLVPNTCVNVYVQCVDEGFILKKKNNEITKR
jgi:hypothetical protein